jgi:TetR/AcrR family transcriptional regulator, regulator of biofilm formation and stress response
MAGDVAVRTKERRARGERRRAEVLAAALRVIAKRGVASTTHRAVADEAGVPSSTPGYYFDSIDELLDEALLMFVRDETTRLEELAARLSEASVSPAELAQLLMEELGQGKDPRLPTEVAQFELYLEAARRPGLRRAAEECLALYADAAEAALQAAGARRPEEGARAFHALIDGFALHRIAVPREGYVAEVVRPALESLFIAYAMDAKERTKWDRRLRVPPEPRPRGR